MRPRTDGPSNNIWGPTPNYDWQPVADGSSLSYETQPLTRTLTMAGTGNVDLWISSSATDSDVQVTLTEVRPDGTERYVQNGWLRLSHRKLDPIRSTLLDPFHSDEAADTEPLTPGQLTEAQIPLLPVRAPVPRRHPDPSHDRGAGWRPARVGVRHADHRRHRRRTGWRGTRRICPDSSCLSCRTVRTWGPCRRRARRCGPSRAAVYGAPAPTS